MTAKKTPKKPKVTPKHDNGGWIDQTIAAVPATVRPHVDALANNWTGARQDAARRYDEKLAAEAATWKEKDAHAATKRALESAQATMHFLAERLVVAEKAVAQRRDDDVHSPGMSDVEAQLLVQCLSSGGSSLRLHQMMAGPFLLGPAFVDDAPPPSKNSMSTGTGFGQRMLQALEAEFIRRGIIDACDAVQGTIEASQSMLVAEFERGIEASVMVGPNADSRDVEHVLRLVRLKERERLGGTVTEEEWEAAHNDEEVPDAPNTGSDSEVPGEGEASPD
jgi:hypothetical protein